MIGVETDRFKYFRRTKSQLPSYRATVDNQLHHFYIIDLQCHFGRYQQRKEVEFPLLSYGFTTFGLC